MGLAAQAWGRGLSPSSCRERSLLTILRAKINMAKFKSASIGIDPGHSGGIAIIGDGFAQAWKMPETEADTAEMFRDLTEWAETVFCFIEFVTPMPKQGLGSTWKFGQHYGFLRGLLIALKIPFDQVRPQVWQKVMNCRTAGDKNISKAKAQQLWPELKITHALADALLIAECCRRRAIPPGEAS